MPTIAIIGSGFSGLCAAIQLKKSGIDTFTIFEKSDAVGGTWRDNVYPGCECDIPSALYSFSFEPKPDWPKKWSQQDAIFGYLKHCAEKYQLLPHIQFNNEITDAAFDQDTGQWCLSQNNASTEKFDVLISAVGQLNRPQTPNIDGLNKFKGESFHSARWNHQVNLHGKDVCVIGNAASATQFIPEIAHSTKSTSIFQRSANWIIPKNDRNYSEWEKSLFKAIPLIPWLNRFWIWLSGELLLGGLMNDIDFLKRKAEDGAKTYAQETLNDSTLVDKIIPDYPIGAKRILFSDTYLPALNKENVNLITETIKQISEHGIITSDGEEHKADVIILATGFNTNDFLAPIKITGLDGKTLDQQWKDGAEAFLGISVHNFPNLFLMYGPNTNLGHNSIVLMIEAQTRYILSCVKAMAKHSLKYIDIKSHIQLDFNQHLQQRLAKKTWATVANSWYMQDGKITNNWAGSTAEYILRTIKANLNNYRQEKKQNASADKIELETELYTVD